MIRPKIYLDTSVINFLFHDDAPEKKEITVDFFQNYIRTGIYEAFVSRFVIEEINQTPSEIRRKELLDAIKTNYIDEIIIRDADDIEFLAAEILKEGIIPPNKVFDAMHIAVSVVERFDFLVTWNYQHLANVNRERKVLALSYKMGYLYPLRIITPLELIGYES
jgi:predicted nucleic acid-binding protein